MTPEDYKFLYSQVDKKKIPNDIYEKIMSGDELNSDEEKQVRKIIEKEQPKKPIEIERCNQKIVWYIHF